MSHTLTGSSYRQTPSPSILIWPDRLTPSELIQIAARAEEAGFGVLWNVEVDWDSFVYDQAVAMGTSRIRTGSGIARAYKRHPLLVAESAATIDKFAPGRFIIGLGTGPVKKAEPAAQLQRWGEGFDRPVEALEEYIHLIRLALSGEAVDFAGQFYAVEDVALEHAPESEIPIYLAAGGPKLCRLAGQVANGAFLFFLGPTNARQWVSNIRAAAEGAGRSPGDVEICGVIPISVHPDGQAARAAIRRHLFFPYLSRPYYQRLIAKDGFPEVSERIQSELAKGSLEGAAKAISDEALDALTIAGDPSDCRARIGDFLDRGYDVPVLYPFPVDEDWAGAYASVIDLYGDAS